MVVRSAMKSKLDWLSRRISQNVKRKEDLQLKLTRANETHLLAGGMTIQEGLNHRKHLLLEKQLLTKVLEIAENLAGDPFLRSNDEPYTVHADTNACSARLQEVNEEINDLNIEFQEANWKYDL